MADTITLSLTKIESRRDTLRQTIESARQELQELEAVERFYRRQRGESPTTDGVPDSGQKPTMADVIRQIVKDRGPIGSAKVIEAVHKALPDAKPSSIRSTCSVLSQKGEFQRKNGKWIVSDASQEGG